MKKDKTESLPWSIIKLNTKWIKTLNITTEHKNSDRKTQGTLADLRVGKIPLAMKSLRLKRKNRYI